MRSATLETSETPVRLLWSEAVPPNTFANNEKLGYSVKDLGVYAGFAIVREADGHEMCRDIRSYSEAMRRIRLEYVPPANGCRRTTCRNAD